MYFQSIELTSSQFGVLSEIARDIAQIFFGSMVVSPFLIGIDRINWVVIIAGAILTLACWIISIALIKKGEKS